MDTRPAALAAFQQPDACRRTEAFAPTPQTLLGYGLPFGQRSGELKAAPRKFLVVDDNDTFLHLVCDMLHALGHSTQAAPSAEKAMEWIGQEPFDVLLTDIKLPGMSGVDLARHAIGMVPSLRVIFSSGHGYLLPQGLDFEFDLLHKPYFLNQLRQVISG